MDQVSSMYALEKNLKIGIISGSLSSNAESRENSGDFQNSVLLVKNSDSESDDEVERSPFLDIAAEILEDPPG